MASGITPFPLSFNLSMLFRDSPYNNSSIAFLPNEDYTFKAEQDFGNAAAALVEIIAFYQDNPSPPSDAQRDLWRSLASIRSICNRLEKESKTHLDRAQSFSSTGKPGDAIREFQEANRIFPDPKIAETIRKLREDSLGL